MRYMFGDYTLDTQCYELDRAGMPIKVRPKVFDVLAFLIVHRDRVISKQELLEHFWPQQVVSEAALKSCIKAVRRATGDTGQAQRLILTLHGRGYRFVAAAQAIILRYGGTITQLEEDGLLALFRAPLAQEDHARRAVLAALDLRQTWQNSQRAANPPLHACIGVHTGLVVVGDLGQEAQRFYTVVGEDVTLAKCLRHRAASDTILISGATQCLAQGEVQTEASGMLDVAAQAGPIPVYTVHHRIRRRSGVPERDGRALSRFVGRERELALLHERLTHAKRGQGQVVGIAGEPGIGKSRLLYEFAQSLRRQPVLYREGHCLAYASTTP
jgi:DNA-binding winged helix-turn-helix (wHTH) protein